MRGSPLLRFFLLALALAATGMGLMRVTAAKEDPPTSPQDPVRNVSPRSIPFRILLSDPAASVDIDSGGASRPLSTGPGISGTLELDPANPSVRLVVRWKHDASVGEHRFAKLTLEAPGEPTFTHFFHAAADIDDFIELPFPAAK